ncbi:unnamed protein product [Schistosoma turkestanicum]|nr:unnamed protein product [Schistosoma turkestanicum]
MESATTIKNQLMVLFDNLKNIQPNERDKLITFMKTTLSQLQENNDNESNTICQAITSNNDNYTYCYDENVNTTTTSTTTTTTTTTTTNVSLTNSSPTYVNLKSSELYNLTNTNVDGSQLSFEATNESVVNQMNGFPTITTVEHHNTATTSTTTTNPTVNLPEVIDVNNYISTPTSKPTLTCSNLTNETYEAQNSSISFSSDNNSNITDNHSTSNSTLNHKKSSYNYYYPNNQIFLHCPLCCQLKFDNWPNLKYHLYYEHQRKSTNHNNVSPICWRCQGIFDNHALLLAHECFDWGRLNLPCAMYMHKSLKTFHQFSEDELIEKQFPLDGVFLNRRCSLCYKANVTYTSYDEFEKHKLSSHSIPGRDSGYEPFTVTSPTNNTSSSLFKSSRRRKKHSTKCNLPIENHPSSDVAIRSVVRSLTERFYALNYHHQNELRQRHCKRKTLPHHDHHRAETMFQSTAINNCVVTSTISSPTTTTSTTTSSTETTGVDLIISTTSTTTTTTTTATTTNAEEDEGGRGGGGGREDDEEKATTPTSSTINSDNAENNKTSSNNCSPSTFLTSLLVAQRVKRNLTLKNKHARRLKAVAFECGSRSPSEKSIIHDDDDDDHSHTDERFNAITALSCNDLPSSPSIHSHISDISSDQLSSSSSSVRNRRRNFWSNCQNTNRHTIKRLKLQFKRKMTTSSHRQRKINLDNNNNDDDNSHSSTLLTNNLMKIRRFTCNQCSAVFRLSSRLRAHYLFQHGHIPECLGGLSPRPNEILFKKQRNLNLSRSNNDISFDNNDERTNSSSLKNTTPAPETTTSATTTTTSSTPTSTPTVTSSLASSCVPNESDHSLPPPSGLMTRSRKRKAVSDNNNTSNNVTIQSSNQLTHNTRRMKKPTSDPVTTNSVTTTNEDRLIDFLSDHSNSTEQVVVTQQFSMTDTNLFYKKFSCLECNQSFKTAYNLKRHQTIIHLHKYRYFCGYCEYRTGERLAYEEHLARHFCIKQFLCEICNARFTIKHELDDHKAFKHSNERNFACTECDQRFKTAGTLWRHKKTHEPKRVYHLCPICSTSFTRLSNLNRHLARTHKQQQQRQHQQREHQQHQPQQNHQSIRLDTNKKLSTSYQHDANKQKKSSKTGQQYRQVVNPTTTTTTTMINNSQQTVEQIYPVEIITPHLSGSDLSSISDQQTLITMIPEHDRTSSKLINISDHNFNKSILYNPSISTSCCDTPSSSTSTSLLSSNIPPTTSTTTTTEILSTQDHVMVTTGEDSIVSTHISEYQTVDLDNHSHSTVFMLNFTDLDTNNHLHHHHHHHEYFEPTDGSHKLMFSSNIHDAAVYEQPTAGFTSTSSSTAASNGTFISSTSYTSASSPTITGTNISLPSNLLLPIRLNNTNVNCDIVTNTNTTTNNETSSSMSSNTNSWPTIISHHSEPSLCYLITSSETIENDVLLCSHNHNNNYTNEVSTTNTTTTTVSSSSTTSTITTVTTNTTDTSTQITNHHHHHHQHPHNLLITDDDDEEIIDDPPQSIASTMDLLNSFQSDLVDHHLMLNNETTMLKMNCPSPQLSLTTNDQCIFYETGYSSSSSSTLPTTTHSSRCAIPSTLSSSTSAAAAAINDPSTSIWRPMDCDRASSIGGNQSTCLVDSQYSIPVNSTHHCSKNTTPALSYTDDITVDDRDEGDEVFEVENYDQRQYHPIDHLFPSHDDLMYTGSNRDAAVDVDDGDDGEEEEDVDDDDDIDDDLDDGEEVGDSDCAGGLTNNHVITTATTTTSTNTTTNSTTNNSTCDNARQEEHQITTDLLDTSLMLSWNPTQSHNHHSSTEFFAHHYYYFYNSQNCSPKFPSPDLHNLSPVSMHFDQPSEERPPTFDGLPLPFPSSSSSSHQLLHPIHDQTTTTTNFTGIQSPCSLLSPVSSITTSTPSSTSSLLCENNLTDCSNYLGQFYHHYKNNNTTANTTTSSDLSSIPNMINNIEPTYYPVIPDDIPNGTDQCSNFSVGYLIGHSTMSPSASSSTSSIATNSRCSLLQTEQTTGILSSICPSSTVTTSSSSNPVTDNMNYLNTPHLSSLPLTTDHCNVVVVQQSTQSSLSQLNFTNDTLDYEFIV